MTTIIIERESEVPPPRCKYPWANIEIGGSFWADIDPLVLRGSVAWQERRHNRRFVVRKEGSGARAYRMA